MIALVAIYGQLGNCKQNSEKNKSYFSLAILFLAISSHPIIFENPDYFPRIRFHPGNFLDESEFQAGIYFHLFRLFWADSDDVGILADTIRED